MKMPKQMNIQLNGRSFRRRTKYSSVNGIQKYAAAINKSEISRRYSIRRSRLARLSSSIFAAEVAPKMDIIGRRRSPRHRNAQEIRVGGRRVAGNPPGREIHRAKLISLFCCFASSTLVQGPPSIEI